MGVFIEKLNCDNLCNGMVFSTYADLCNFLGVVPGRGNSLVAQKKLFSRYFTFERYEGRKCKIIQVYDKPLLDDFTYNQLHCSGKGKYVRYIEPMLCKLIGNRSPDGRSDGGEFYIFSKADLFSALGLTNPNFYKKDAFLRNSDEVVYFKPSKKYPDALSIDGKGKLVISTNDTEFFETIGEMVYDKWRSAAKAINGHGILQCDAVYSLIGINNKVRIANQSELIFIKEAENEIIREMDLDSIQQVALNHKYKLFCKKRNVKFGELMGTSKVSIFETIKVSINGDIKDCIDGGIPLEEMRQRINQMIVEDFYKRIDKLKREFDDGWNEKKWGDPQKATLQRKDFCDIMKKLVDVFIKI